MRTHNATRRSLISAGATAAILAVSKPSAAAPDSDADAAIVALVDKIMALYRQGNRLSELQETTRSRLKKALTQDKIWKLENEVWDMRAELAGMRATTPTGFRAKAAMVREFSNCRDGYATGYEDDALAWSLANDLLGVPSILKEEEEPGPGRT
jgi:hypothetical protein